MRRVCAGCSPILSTPDRDITIALSRACRVRRPGASFAPAQITMPGHRVPQRSGCPSPRQRSSLRKPLPKRRSSSSGTKTKPTVPISLRRSGISCGRLYAGGSVSCICKRYEYLYYCCAGKDPLTVGRVERCASRRVRADRLDALVWTLVRELLPDPQVILQEYALWQQVQRGQQGQFQAQLDRIDGQRQHLERQLQRLIDAYQQEIITLQDLATRREQLAQRLKGFEQERHHLEQQRDTTIKWEHIADNIGQFRALLGSNLDRLSYEDRQAVVQLVVEKVIVYPDGAVEVHHVLPFEDLPI